jgi:diguanylate cyclase (GGDEF)-like protein/PAS domain S-box-containing protein
MDKTMKNAQQETRDLIASIAADEQAMARRKAFLQFDAIDVARLRTVHADLTAQRAEVADAFYDHLLQFPTLQTLLPDATTLARLKSTQERYFTELTAGDYGHDYIANRLAVGVMHRRVGLEPEWYIGAYRKYLALIAPLLWQQLGQYPDQFFSAYGAILKVVCLDMSLAIDAYIQAERQETLALKSYAEQLIAVMPSGLIVAGLDGRISNINMAARQLFGVTQLSEQELCGRHVGSLCEALSGYLQSALEASAGSHQYDVALTSASATRYLRCNISPTQVGQLPSVLIVVEDVTQAILARKELRESEERFRLAFGQAAVGLAHLDKDGRWLRVNQKLLEIVGYSEAVLLTLRLHDLAMAEDLAEYQQIWGRLLGGEVSSYSQELRFRRNGGMLVWVNITVAPMRADGNAGASHFIAVIEDISQRKDAEARLQHLANHDPLTGLANRSLLHDRLDQAIIYAHRAHRFVAVLYIDLDRFKNINDSLGHAMGDRLIIEVARRLQASVREGDTVARLGGDEFVVVLADIAHDDEVAGLTRKIMAALLVPLFIEGQELSAIGSMGVSIYSRDGSDSTTLLKNADAAMYRAKENGRSNVQFYEREMNVIPFEPL